MEKVRVSLFKKEKTLPHSLRVLVLAAFSAAVPLQAHTEDQNVVVVTGSKENLNEDFGEIMDVTEYIDGIGCVVGSDGDGDGIIDYAIAATPVPLLNSKGQWETDYSFDIWYPKIFVKGEVQPTDLNNDYFDFGFFGNKEDGTIDARKLQERLTGVLEGNKEIVDRDCAGPLTS